MVIFDTLIKAATGDAALYRSLKDRKNGLLHAAIITATPIIFSTVLHFLRQKLSPLLMLEMIISGIAGWALISYLFLLFGKNESANNRGPAITIAQAFTVTGFVSSPQLFLMWGMLLVDESTMAGAKGAQNTPLVMAWSLVGLLSIIWYFRLMKIGFRETFNLEGWPATKAALKVYVLTILVFLLIGLMVPRPSAG